MPKTVDANTAKRWLDANEAVLVDVREMEEFMSARIPGAALIPVNTLHLSLLPPVQGKKLVLHCHSGVRSANACEILQAQDATLDAYNLEGGILAWGQAGLPIITKGAVS